MSDLPTLTLGAIVSTTTSVARPIVTAESVALLFGGHLSSASIWFGNSSGVVSVNTQARRLGCLVYLAGLVSQGRKVESLLFSVSASDVALLKANLSANGYNSGHLTTTASSVRHYADLALGLHLLVQQGAVFDLTVRGRFLLDAVQPKSKEPYPLSPEAKVFFLHLLLAFDYLGMAAIIRSLRKGAAKISELRQQHQSELLQLLDEVSRTTSNPRLQRSLRDRLIAIRNWKKPESYCEHLVSAKLNWLTDLGILQSPPSANSSMLFAEVHQHWLGDWASAVEPTEAHLASLLLRYAQLVVPNSGSQVDVKFCATLQMAFDRLASPGKLAKIRLSDFVLLLISFQPHALIRLIEGGGKLFPESVLHCEDAVYKAHPASRSTQSYIVREAVGDR